MIGASASLEFWPWLAVAGLGAFHGLNPGMGWLFALALGLHRRKRRIVWFAVVPIALGHALSVAAVAFVFLWLGWIVDGRAVRVGAARLLICWAFYHSASVIVIACASACRWGLLVSSCGRFSWRLRMAQA